MLPHLDAAYRFARWLGPLPGEVDDVVQEAFLRAFRAFDGLRGGDTKAWLLAILRNCHADALRTRRRLASVPLTGEIGELPAAVTADAPAGPECAATAADEAATLARVLATLATEHREVLLLREREELSYREIAAVIQVPVGTVMSRLARARAALREGWRRETEEVPRAVR